MATIAVADVQTRARKRYPDLDDGVTDTADLMQEVHDDILSRVPIVLTTETFSSLVAGTATYSMNAETLRVWDVYYVRSSTAQDDKQLKFTTPRWLSLNKRRWRTAPNAEPEYAYVIPNSSGARLLGLYQPPAVTSSASYPQVVCYVSRSETLSTNLPTIIDDLTPYLHGIWWRFLVMWRSAEEAQQFKKEYYDPAVMALNAKLQIFLAGNVPIIQPWVRQSASPR